MNRVIIVDENNREIGLADRSEMRRRNLWHRGTAILVMNSDKNIFVHQRKNFKDLFPLYYDMFFGGVLDAGEDYDINAKKELFEESGLTSPLEFLFDMKISVADTRVHTRVYKTEYDGGLRLSEDEVEKGFFVTREKLEEMLKKEKFCPDSVIIFNRMVEEGYL